METKVFAVLTIVENNTVLLSFVKAKDTNEVYDILEKEQRFQELKLAKTPFNHKICEATVYSKEQVSPVETAFITFL